ncbi:MAG: DUF1467 family protein [Salaquimonas sp.]|jgi:predicted secreted protein|nr:DUF1467 family protein [Salaquimonas sp.]
MSFFTGFAVYFVIWWLTLFMVLPFGVKTQQEEGEVTLGTVPSSPERTRLGLKLAINSVIAGIIFVTWYWLTYHVGLGFDQIPSVFPQDR